MELAILTLSKVLLSLLGAMRIDSSVKFIKVLIQADKSGTKIDTTKAFYYLGNTIVVKVLIIFIKNHVYTYTGVVLTRIRAGLLLTILEKQLSFEFSTNSIHSSGSIANYLQVDIEKGVEMFEIYLQLVATSSKIFFSLYLVF